MKRYKMRDARVAGCIAGRAGLSERAIELIEAFDGSYKGAIQLAGALSVFADMATFDRYWEEQVLRGVIKATDWLELTLESGEK